MGGSVVGREAKNAQEEGAYSPTTLGYVAGAVSVFSTVCAGYTLFNESTPIRITAGLLGVIGLIGACTFIIRFRMEFTKHGKRNSYVANRARKREIYLTSWAVIVACIGISADILTFMWVING